MKKSFVVLLALPVAAYSWACSSSSSSDNGGSDAGSGSDSGGSGGGPGGNPGVDGGGTPVADSGGAGNDAGNGVSPISGIAAPTLVVDGIGGGGGYMDSLRYFSGTLYASDPLINAGAGVQYTIDTANQVANVFREPSNGASGIAVDTKASTLIGTEFAPAADVVRIFADGGASVLASGWDAGTGPLTPFDSPNDLTMRKSDGTIYFTDPGYPAGVATTNHVFKLLNGVVSVVDTCTDACHPNGIAISPSESFLYVSYTYSPGTQAVIKKFPIKSDGTLGAGTLFTNAGASVDGMAIDDSGNLYAAYASAVAVYAPNGTKWGDITLPGGLQPETLAFGGASRTTLYIGAQSGVYSVTVKVAGRTE